MLQRAGTSVTTLEGLQAMVDDYLTHDAFVFDVETVPEDGDISERRSDVMRNRVAWISFATDGRADVLPLAHPNGALISAEKPLTPAGERRKADNARRAKGTETDARGKIKLPLPLDPERTPTFYSDNEDVLIRHFGPAPRQLHWGDAVVEILEPLFFSDRLKIGHNIRFDLKSIAGHFDGRIPSPPYADTAMAGFILNSQYQGRLSLDNCVERELGYTLVKGIGKKIEIHSFADVERYSWIDSRYDWLLYLTYIEQIEAAGLRHLWDLEMDVIDVVTRMEMTGAPVKVDRLKELDVYLRKRVRETETAIYHANGQRAFNIDSNLELATALFTKKADGGAVGLTPKVLTATGQKNRDAGKEPVIKDWSVGEKALKALSGNKPIVADVLTYHDLRKLHTCFIVPYLGPQTTTTKINGETVTSYDSSKSLLIENRIYATFRPDGATTGRFSCKDPNLQQVPSRSADGLKVRACFSVEDLDDIVMVQADYSQIEPRILADFCLEPRLVDAYLEGGSGDIYTELGEPFGLDRNGAKVLFLSICYGTGPQTLADACGITLTDAKAIIYRQFPREFPKVMKFKQEVVLIAKRRKPSHVSTMLGRRIYLPELLSSTQWMRERAERQAFNGLIQGSAADINKIGLVRCDRAITPLGGRLFATVHDEVLALAPKSNAEEIAVLVRQALEGAGALMRVVPLIAETKIVNNWAEVKS